MFNIIAILIILISKLLPPYDRNGNVIPVVGMVPVTTNIFKDTWRIIPNDKPNERYFSNKLVWFKDILIDDINIVINKDKVNIVPIIPNSSEMILNIKSV